MTAQDEQGVNAAVDPEVSHYHTVTACASCTRQPFLPFFLSPDCALSGDKY